MRKEFSGLKKTPEGTTVPVLLVGPSTVGKETNFLALLAEQSPSMANRFRVPLLEHDSTDTTHQSIVPGLDSVFSKITDQVKEKGGLVVLFESVDFYEENAFKALLERVGKNGNPDIVYIFSGHTLPFLGVAEHTSKMQWVEIAPVAPSPVMQVEEHEESELHQYTFKADFLAKYPAQIDSPTSKELLESVASLVEAMKGMGDILGQEAHDRGMDASVIRALAGFSRVYKDTSNRLASDTAHAFVSMIQASQPKPRFLELHSEPEPDQLSEPTTR